MPAEPGSRRRIYEQEPYSGSSAHKPVDPHSEWQLMVEAARTKKKLSLRKLGDLSRIPSGNLFNWLRSPKGHPTRTAYSSSVNNRLASALALDPEELAAAYNRSAFRPVDPKKEDPPVPRAPRPGSQEDLPGRHESLQRFMATLRSTGRQHFTLVELETIAAMLAPATSAE